MQCPVLCRRCLCNTASKRQAHSHSSQSAAICLLLVFQSQLKYKQAKAQLRHVLGPLDFRIATAIATRSYTPPTDRSPVLIGIPPTFPNSKLSLIQCETKTMSGCACFCFAKYATEDSSGP